MIKTVVRFPNDMVMVFDEKGEQIPKYQGPYEEVRDEILRDASPDAIFGQTINSRGETHLKMREKW